MLFFALPPAYAHQPRISFGSGHPLTDPVVVKKPEISKAYYGELTGTPDYYQIDSLMPFKFYLNILVPDEPNARLDMNVQVMIGSKPLFMMRGQGYKWENFREEFARDSYLKGPELQQNIAPGKYYIKVYNRDNYGKYCLVIGKIESFSVNQIIKTAFTLPGIKVHFFAKPAYSAFLNPIGLFLLAYLLISLAVIWVIVFLIRRINKRRHGHDN